MKNPHNLDHKTLATIVEAVQDLLYGDPCWEEETLEPAGYVYDPDNEWSGADVCTELADVLNGHGLLPEKKDDEREVAAPHHIGCRVCCPRSADDGHLNLKECIATGRHLTDVDGDGYCNFCGEQDSGKELADA